MSQSTTKTQAQTVLEYLRKEHDLGKSLPVHELAMGIGVHQLTLEKAIDSGVWSYPLLMYINKYLSLPTGMLWLVHHGWQVEYYSIDPRTQKQLGDIVPRAKDK